jgi:hypothetical protein
LWSRFFYNGDIISRQALEYVVEIQVALLIVLVVELLAVQVSANLSVKALMKETVMCR